MHLSCVRKRWGLHKIVRCDVKDEMGDTEGGRILTAVHGEREREEDKVGREEGREKDKVGREEGRERKRRL